MNNGEDGIIGMIDSANQEYTEIHEEWLFNIGDDNEIRILFHNFRSKWWQYI